MDSLINSVSVIISTFNRAEVLPLALKSVSSQTTKPLEIIVIDDGSTDDTKVIVKSSFPEVSYLFQKNSGVSVARNWGIQTAKGEWIAFLDSDDEWQPLKLQKQLEALENNQEYKICHTDEIWVRNGKRVNPMNKHRKFGGWIFQKCLPLCCISPSSVIIHKSVFEKVWLFDESLPVCEDYDMWLRITSRYPVLYLKEPLITKYGGHPDQLSKKYWGMDRFRIKAIENILEEDILNEDDHKAAVKTMKEKINIILQGATKRGNKSLVETHKEKLNWLSGIEMVN